MIKKAILRGTTYEKGDFMGDWPIIAMEKKKNELVLTTGDLETNAIRDEHSFSLRDGDFLKFEDDTIETFKLGGHDDGDDL